MSSADDEEIGWESSSECEEGDDDCDQEFLPEMGAFGDEGRVGFTKLTGNAPKTRMEKAAQEPLEKFTQSVEAVALSIKIAESDIDEMNKKAEYLDTVEHKNPTAYVLGFLASGKGNLLNQTNYRETVSKYLPLIDKESCVYEHDIIRYARLWLELNKKVSK